VLVTGGNLHYPATSPIGKYQGLNHVYTFDPFTETWKQQPDMAHGRWYPSQLLMPDGRTFIMGGLDENGVETEDLEMFTPAAARGGQGTISLVGRTGDPGSGRPPTGNYYPHLFWMPSGHGSWPGPTRTTRGGSSPSAIPLRSTGPRSPTSTRRASGGPR
jgi:hypothetical protein